MIRLFLKLACVLSLCSDCIAADLKEAEVFVHNPKLGALGAIRTYKTQIKGDGQSYDGEFIAREYEKWALSVRLTDGASGDPLSLNVPENEILGKQGLTEKCLKKFMSDVPGAFIHNVEIEVRSSPQLRLDFRTYAKAHFDSRSGTITDIKVVDREMANVLEEFLKSSKKAQDIAREITSLLGYSKYRLRAIPEAWSSGNTMKVGDKLSAIGHDPALGYKRPVCFNIYLEGHQ